MKSDTFEYNSDGGVSEWNSLVMTSKRSKTGKIFIVTYDPLNLLIENSIMNQPE
jgi:hypothetical protein